MSEDAGAFGRPQATAVEKVGRRLVEVGFGQSDSVLAPGESIWTSDNLAELKREYSDRPDAGSGGFFEKLDQQLATTSRGAIQLFAELLIVNVLPIINLSGALKLKQVQTVLDRCDPPVVIPDDVQEALVGGGVYHGGQAFGNYKWKQIVYLIEVAQHFKQLSEQRRVDALADPLIFRDEVDAVTTGQAAQRQSLLYLAFPDFFLPIVSAEHRRLMRDAFEVEYLGRQVGDVDTDLHDIYDAIREKHGAVDLYASPWLEKWQKTKPKEAGPGENVERNGRAPGADVKGQLRLADATSGLAERLSVPVDWLQECIELLRDRPQLIFYGPPGTGKTYIAQELAGHLTTEANVKIVQFHPAYTYEDFFEGYRPKGQSDGQVGFTLTSGPLRSLVDKAKDNPEAVYILIIDEINRGNLAKIFGELYFLLEYRDHAIDLLYSSDNSEPFSMPKNIVMLGTMNTADRSIALVDAAMRRRFAFLPLHPSESPTNGVLRKWLEANSHPVEVADLLELLNVRIDDPDFKIGPSYFMRPAVHDAGGKGLERVWRTAILPLLEEHHYGDGTDVHARYGLDTIRKALEAKNKGPVFAKQDGDDGIATDHSD